MLKLAWAMLSRVARVFRASPTVPITAKPALPAEGGALDVERAGQWFFRRDVLDRLDTYFTDIAGMRKEDPEAYQLYAQYGGVVAPADTALLRNELFDRSRVSRPNRVPFGAVQMSPGAVPDAEARVRIRFIWFRKIKPVGRRGVVQPLYESTYEVTAFLPRKRQTFVPVWFHVGVDRAGQVRLLKVRGEFGSWGYPATVLQWAKDNGQTPQALAAGVFVWAFSVFCNASTGLRVDVEKGGVHAVFGVDMLRTPYFFADRDTTVSVGGRRKKIFHIVRTHPRTLPDGRVVYVKSHFRGERAFDWNGYAVKLSMPGKHHADWLDASFAGSPAEADENPGLLSAKDAGLLVRGALDKD